jgi:hypothetical protein
MLLLHLLTNTVQATGADPEIFEGGCEWNKNTNFWKKILGKGKIKPEGGCGWRRNTFVRKKIVKKKDKIKSDGGCGRTQRTPPGSATGKQYRELFDDVKFILKCFISSKIVQWFLSLLKKVCFTLYNIQLVCIVVEKKQKK